jgi:hypothetical protein
MIHTLHIWARDDRPAINLSWHNMVHSSADEGTRAQPSFVAIEMRNGIGDIIRCRVVPERVESRSLGPPAMWGANVQRAAEIEHSPRVRCGATVRPLAEVIQTRSARVEPFRP